MAFVHSLSVRASASGDRRPIQSHAVLRLPAAVDDPVRIIRAAQIQLRRWRREVANAPAVPRQQQAGEIVGDIIAARELLLRRSLMMQTPQAGVESTHEGCRSERAGQQTGGERLVSVGGRCAAELVGSAARG
jgi:hypothetical protein